MGTLTISATTTVQGDGTWGVTINTSSLSPGTITVVATGTDDSGNTSTVSNTITKNQVAPILTIDEPIEGDNIANNGEFTTVTISGTGQTGLDVTVSIDDN